MNKDTNTDIGNGIQDKVEKFAAGQGLTFLRKNWLKLAIAAVVLLVIIIASGASHKNNMIDNMMNDAMSAGHYDRSGNFVKAPR